MMDVVKIVARRKRKNVDIQKSKDSISDMDLDALDWRPIEFPLDSFINEENAGGYTMLEEIDGVDVVYENDDSTGAKVVKFKQAVDTSAAPVVDAKPGVKERKDTAKRKPEFHDRGTDISQWESMGLHPTLLQGLNALGYSRPTEIQSRIIPMAIHKRQDIIGAAETGSGKTLAFGLPVINKIQLAIDKGCEGLDDPERLPALILSPTRELAVQIRDHLTEVAKYTDVKIAAILGGMSLQKQQRVIRSRPHIIIATPGRLWQWISEEESGGYLSKLYSSVRFLVIDEADRMVEKGHFKDLTSIMNTLEKAEVVNEWDRDFNVIETIAGGDCDAALDESVDGEDRSCDRQTLIFSATMGSFTRNEDLKKGSDTEALESLLHRVKVRNPDRVKIVDVTTDQLTARNLTESRIDCLLEDKDKYLYYFVTRYPGRTIVFVNTIDCIQRIVHIMEKLRVQVYPLHAKMQQRQRLKNLDRFKSSSQCVLVCSDVASRGLDIPNIDHVVHYQLPLSVELYVHRSGRTARAEKEGISIMINSPKESKQYHMICRHLNKNGQNSIPEFHVDKELWMKLAERVDLARELGKASHVARRKKSSNAWLRKAAEDMDIVLDPSLLESESDTEELEDVVSTKRRVREQEVKTQLGRMLDEPLFSNKSRTSYVSRLQQLGGLSPEQLQENIKKGVKMPSYAQTSALDEVKYNKKRRRSKYKM